MTYPTTARKDGSSGTQVLLVALELSVSTWKVAMGVGHGQPRRVDVEARDLNALLGEVEKGREHFGLPADVHVVSCYEAGRDGFWLHRTLVAGGVESLVIDAGSIEVPRKGRRPKTDRLDVQLLHRKLVSYWSGEKVWSVVCVPPEEVEDERRLSREIDRMKNDKRRLRNRIWSDLALEGIRPKRLPTSAAQVAQLRCWNGKELPPMLRLRVERGLEDLARVRERLAELESIRNRKVREPETANDRKAALLAQLRGIGVVSGSKIVAEHLWRQFDNRRQVAAAAGLTPTPHNTGMSEREVGLSKQGNPRVRSLMVELSWLWLRYQPDSAISRWWCERYGDGSKRSKKSGICAVARRLLIALWKMVEFGEVPEGARLKVA